MGTSMRGKLNNWAFFQLKNQISYKAARVGVVVNLVDPRNTSRTCPDCGCCEKGNLKCQSVFKCLARGYTANADLNAARNIARAAQLLISRLECDRRDGKAQHIALLPRFFSTTLEQVAQFGLHGFGVFILELEVLRPPIHDRGCTWI